MGEYPPIQHETEALKDAAGILNTHFRRGRPAHQMLEEIRMFPKPIAVDFNNVIANNRYPLMLNPDAPSALDILHKSGNVCIVTHAFSKHWDLIRDFMENNRVWSPSMVLMPLETYNFLSSPEDPNGRTLRQEYLDRIRDLGWGYTQENVCRDLEYKPVAPLFGKRWKIPFIDNTSEPTQSPGVFGIEVKTWRLEEECGRYTNIRELRERDRVKPSFLEAAQIVRQYYSGEMFR